MIAWWCGGEVPGGLVAGWQGASTPPLRGRHAMDAGGGRS
ncbi:hypothetical protein HNR21_006909 [Actinomadura cellulosilytica]|uniref:Uncharacterized protein n=1 Tax=Thermomonospora cellulosilytica TaxID=1411118 RepID=A0A7W3RCF9_9ACTN|nr:hypothetical protein [Thermomonospora cellulosilytica]MBA9008027.1 hypothetical protein [Thermomonospora cellulosilytica]